MQPIAIATTDDDIEYVRTHYVTLDQLARGLDEARWAGSRLPRATYLLPDGTAWYPRDWWRLHDEAAGDLTLLPDLFARRLRATSNALHHPCNVADTWTDYLAGLYGTCLRDVTPETIVLKERLVAHLDRTLADPHPADPAWLLALRADVDSLDGLCRPFAACDRTRFGRPTSRDRLIDGPRRAFPHAFATRSSP